MFQVAVGLYKMLGNKMSRGGPCTFLQGGGQKNEVTPLATMKFFCNVQSLHIAYYIDIITTLSGMTYSLNYVYIQ